MNEQPTAQNQPQQQTTQPDQPVMTGLRKRQQIQNTNKQIFIWLAIASVIVSICLVALQFLIREFLFNQDIINKKSATDKTLVANIKNATALKDNVNKLLADHNLSALKYEAQNTKTSALSVILDALPVEGDATAFANSLQSVVLPRSGVTLRELSTTANQDGTAIASEPSTADGAATSTPVSLPFTVGFTGTYGDVKHALTDVSRVIRPINPTEMSIRAGDEGQLVVTLGGVTYYQPARAVDVRMEVMKP